MGNPEKKGFFAVVKEFVSTASHSRTLGLLFLLLIIAAVPLTVFVAQQRQETRQRASEFSCEGKNFGDPCAIDDTYVPYKVCDGNQRCSIPVGSTCETTSTCDSFGSCRSSMCFQITNYTNKRCIYPPMNENGPCRTGNLDGKCQQGECVDEKSESSEGKKGEQASGCVNHLDQDPPGDRKPSQICNEEYEEAIRSGNGDSNNKYIWKAIKEGDNYKTCQTKEDCPNNESLPWYKVDGSNWCYGFKGGADKRCLQLQKISGNNQLPEDETPKPPEDEKESPPTTGCNPACTGNKICVGNICQDPPIGGANTGKCTTYPPISPPADKHKWKATCGDNLPSCYVTADNKDPHYNDKCSQNNFDPLNVDPKTSNWCYGFSGKTGTNADWRCLMLVREGCEKRGDPGCEPIPVTPTKSVCQATSVQARFQKDEKSDWVSVLESVVGREVTVGLFKNGVSDFQRASDVTGEIKDSTGKVVQTVAGGAARKFTPAKADIYKLTAVCGDKTNPATLTVTSTGCNAAESLQPRFQTDINMPWSPDLTNPGIPIGREVRYAIFKNGNTTLAGMDVSAQLSIPKDSSVSAQVSTGSIGTFKLDKEGDYVLSATCGTISEKATVKAIVSKKLADLNKDGNVDILDFNILRDRYLKQDFSGCPGKVASTLVCADINRDGNIDIFDFHLWLLEAFPEFR